MEETFLIKMLTNKLVQHVAGKMYSDKNLDKDQIIIQYLTPLEELPKSEPTHFYLKSPMTVSIVGAGYKGGQPKSGVELAPAYYRKKRDYKKY